MVSLTGSRRFARAHPYLMDGAIALLAYALTAASALPIPDRPSLMEPLALTLGAAGCAALVFRRR